MKNDVSVICNEEEDLEIDRETLIRLIMRGEDIERDDYEEEFLI